MSSAFYKNHTPVEHMSGAEILRETTIGSEIRRWDASRPGVRLLNEQFQDLILFEPGLRQLMSRLPMLVRAGEQDDSPLPKHALTAMRSALASWQPVLHFYQRVSPALDTHIARTNEFFDSTAVERHKNGSLALQHFSKEIEFAARSLAAVVSALYEAGFTPSAVAPSRLPVLQKSA